jgi:uncharacterized protein (DUF1015 family)
MAEIYPFRGVRYNPSLVQDISAVICPPYDIITPQARQELYRRSEYNFVRLESAWELPQDSATDNKYIRSAATLKQWLERGILKPDEKPAIYLHDQYFTYQGNEHRRRGIIACVRLEEWDRMVIRPHEGTLAQPKDDRISLLWALQANTSPILVLYEDQGYQVSSLLSVQEQSEPAISATGVKGERHYIWAITDPEVTAQICRSLAHQPLYIADGHHRYESALTYQRERRACSPSAGRVEPFDFVMMTLVDFADPGLVILPPHRLVRGLSRATLSELAVKLKSFFQIEELPLGTPGVWQQVDAFLKQGEASQDRLALFGLAPERLFLLRLEDLAATKEMMPYFHSELYKRLAVSIVDHVILERLLGLGGGGHEAMLGYTYERQAAVDKVLDQEYQLAILISPVRAEVVRSIADAGDRMPRKSTYFYPKLPSGLVFYRLV